jgi:DNA-binding transcriptional LysR family regulator
MKDARPPWHDQLANTAQFGNIQSPMSPSDLEGIPVFVAVAEQRSFRAASERLGVTRSAVSQAIRRLEERLGVTLLHRTTRSVHLTEAGERLYDAVRPALSELGAAL